MTRIPCDIEYTSDGVVVTCSRCEVSTRSFGHTDASIRRCFALLREQCDETNFYYDESEC